MSLFRFVQWISEGRPVAVYGDGTQSRDFTYVDDIAMGTVTGLKSLGYEVINLGSDHHVIRMNVIHMVEEMTGKKANIDFQPPALGDVRATGADIGKAERLLGWRPQETFEKGVSNLVTCYHKNREWARNVVTL